MAVKKPNVAPSTSNQGSVPHRSSAHHPAAAGKAICKPIEVTRLATCMPVDRGVLTSFMGVHSLERTCC